MYSYGPPHMAKAGHKYCSYVRIRDVAQKTCQRQWTIGRSGERGSGISVLAARHDDDDDYSHGIHNYHMIIKKQDLVNNSPVLFVSNFIIYICCHSQRDCFVVSQLFSVARYVRRLKPGSKLDQLYVRLSIRPLGQQA